MKKFLVALALLLVPAAAQAGCDGIFAAGKVCGASSLGIAKDAFSLGTSGHVIPFLDGNNTFSGTNTFNSTVTVPTPSNGTDAATKQYVDNTSAGLVTHTQVRLATNGVLSPANTYSNGTAGVGATLTGTSNAALVMDGVTVTVGDRVLVKNEATASHNGIYTVTTVGSGAAAYVLTRATDANSAGTGNVNKIGFGTYVFVTAGTTYISTGWSVNATVTTIGTDAINWVQFSAGGGVTSIGGVNGSLTLSAALAMSGSQLTVTGPWIFVKDYGVKCDGVTDDATTIHNAVVAANGKVLMFPAGATCIISAPINICIASTCADGSTGGSVPKIVDFNRSTIKMSGVANDTYTKAIYVENNNSVDYMYFTMKNLVLDVNVKALIGLEVGGCGYCTFENIDIKNSGGAGLSAEGWALHGLFYTVFKRISSQNNSGTGIQEFSYTAGTSNKGPYGGGTVGCSSGNAYNNNNTFIAVGAVFNGSRGWDVNCAHNVHIGSDAESNVDTGYVWTNILGSSEWFGGYSECNANSHCTIGGTDSSGYNTDNSSGIYIYGGLHEGQFVGVTAANGDVLAIKNIVGYGGIGFTSNCNGSGKSCMTLP